MFGSLYLIKSGKYLKIGYTNNLDSRLKSYQTHNPNYQLLFIREGTQSDEYFLHKIFEKYRINNTEWMVYKEDIINTFKTIKLNHRPSVKNDKKRASKKRKKHVQEIIKRRKQFKEAKTIIINKYGQKTTYF